MRVYADEEVVLLSPDRLGYKDRGMMKWQGLMLSDHVEALKKEKQKSGEVVEIDEEQDEQQIGEQLFLSLARNKWVSVQENVLDRSDYVPPVMGVVIGFKEPYVFLQTKDGRRKVMLQEIRHVKPFDYNKWQAS